MTTKRKKRKMAKFDLSQYATVEERLRAFWGDPENADARIVTLNHSTSADVWVMEARLYVSAGDQANDLPKTTGWASEANTDAFALERCETSAIGRMLANYLYSGNKRGEPAPRPSREEMEKVARMDRNWVAEAEALDSVDDLRLLWNEAKAAKAAPNILAKVKARAEQIAGSEHQGTA